VVKPAAWFCLESTGKRHVIYSAGRVTGQRWLAEGP